MSDQKLGHKDRFVQNFVQPLEARVLLHSITFYQSVSLVDIWVNFYKSHVGSKLDH